MSETADSIGSKKAKRQTVKAPGRSSALRVKSTIHLSLEASQRLDIHCTMMGFDRSEMVEKLINEHLRRYVVSDRGGTNSPGEGETAA
jgi:hypothetical protein